MVKFIRSLLKCLFFVFPPLGVRVAYLVFCWPVFGKIRNREQKIRSKAKQSGSIINGKLIRQFRWGNGDQTALLVHGWASNGGCLGGFVNPLMESGYQVLAFDGPAHGESEGHLTNLIDFSHTVSEVIREKKPEMIITHSFGSAATVLALSDNADIYLSKLVMLTTPDVLEDVIRDFSNLMDLSDRQHNLLVKYISHRFERNIEDMVVHKLVRGLNVDQAMLIHDKKDDVLAFESAVRVAKNWKDLLFIPVQNKGHYRILWDKEVIHKALEII